jgi:hypothetical protein
LVALDVIVIVGHGPSIYQGLGAVIDTMTVVRLKRGLTPDPTHWGSRTDYLCACSPRFDHGKFQFWLVEQSGNPKLTTGTAAVLEAHKRLAQQIYVIGFDRVMHPDRPDPKHTWLAHDKWAEQKILKALGVKELGQVC